MTSSRPTKENMASNTPSRPLSPPPSAESMESEYQNGTESSVLKPLPPSMTRLWRPAAQRNLRNQWSKLASYRQQWSSSSSSARSHATSLVNSYLSQRYMNAMDLGVLSDMPDIRKKACWKLYKQQELHRRNLLSSYKDMVAVTVHMVNTSRSMRHYLKGCGSPIVLFSSSSEDKNDNGDGGGIPVYAFWSISSFEELAHELVQMFRLELNLKRLLVVELLSISSEEVPVDRVCWLDELYPGEFDDLCLCGLFSKEVGEPIHPKIEGWKSDTSVGQSNREPDQEVLQVETEYCDEICSVERRCGRKNALCAPLIHKLNYKNVDPQSWSSGHQVYLTTWLAEVNIDTFRVDDIFAIVGEEMHVSLS